MENAKQNVQRRMTSAVEKREIWEVFVPQHKTPA